MNKLLHTSSSPHVRDQTDTTRIMIDVIIALMPATLYGIYQFKLNAALIVVVSVLTCVLSEYLFEYFMKKPITIKDCSAIVTRTHSCIKSSIHCSFMDTSHRRSICDYYRKTVIWWVRTEFYESCFSCTLFLAYFIYWTNDKFRL